MRRAIGTLVIAGTLATLACTSPASRPINTQPGQVPPQHIQQINQIPRPYSEQIDYKFQNGIVIPVVGVGSEKDPNFDSPMGGEWFAEDNLVNLVGNGESGKDRRVGRFDHAILMLYSVDCPDYGQALPIYQDLARQHAGQIAFLEAEIHYTEVNWPLITRWGDRSPTFIGIKGGREIGLFTDQDYELPELRDRLERLISR